MGRGKSQETLHLIDVCYAILEAIQPCTVRGVCYQLFTQGLITSMAKNETGRVGKLITYAREQEIIPWEWVVDETRAPERAATWRDPEQFKAACRRSYRRDRWEGQDEHVEVWSEKGTIRGVLAPVLEEYAVTFRVMHGYASATAIRQAAVESAGDTHPWTVFYVGDYDPSGMYMSEVDLPERLAEYGGEVELKRVALVRADVFLDDLRSFDADTKVGDTRYKWFIKRYGGTCWELDAMNPNTLRTRVSDAIVACIEPESWKRYDLCEQAEQKSLSMVLDRWTKGILKQVRNTRVGSETRPPASGTA
jgi:hypothetical protein